MHRIIPKIKASIFHLKRVPHFLVSLLTHNKHRLASVFFFALMLFASSYDLMNFVVKGSAERKLLAINETITGGDTAAPLQINPAYKDPNVKSTDKVKPLITSVGQDTRPTIDGVTDAARKTAITTANAYIETA